MSDNDRQSSPGGPADLSPGATIVAFDPIVPPLRIPVPAGVNDDPSNGKWLLAFKDDESWMRGWHMCHGKISEQCEMGARMGCSISAANLCRTPWWKQALVLMKVSKLGEEDRAACEERKMMECLAGSKETCTKFARDTCDPVFADARIAESHVPLDPRFTAGPTRRRVLTEDGKLLSENAFDQSNTDALLANGSYDGKGNEGNEYCESSGADPTQGTTNYRGRQLMDRESIQKSQDGPDWSQRPADGRISLQTEAPIDGWEGGLIGPKIESQTKQSGDLSSVRREEPFWQGVQHRVKSLFKDMRF